MIHRILLAILLLAALPARAADLAGVTLPDTRVVDGATLRLNGIAGRTYTVFRVTVYVVGLYLERPTRDAAAILRSPERKLIEVRYLRDVGENDVRRAWRVLLDANCPTPCGVPAASIERFLLLSPGIRAGSSGTYVLTQTSVTVIADGRPIGTIPGADFAQLLLATFIGAEPTSASVRAALLGG